MHTSEEKMASQRKP